MRVLYASRGYTPHDFRFLEALTATGHEIHFVGFDPGRKLESRPFPARISSIKWLNGIHKPRLFAFFLREVQLRDHIRTIKPDLVHAGPIQGVSALFALLRFQPLVSMSWGSDLLLQGRRRFGRWVAEFTLNHSDALICDAECVKAEALAMGYPPEKTIVLPWGVDLKLFQPGPTPQLRQKLGWQDCFVFICTRNWEPIYGVENVLDAFLQASVKIPKARLMMVGSGSLERELKMRIENSMAASKVALVGRVEYPELPDYYRSADVYISASYSDGSSVSLLEAMASGMPVLVSEIPGNMEWIRSEQQGQTFSAGDVPALASKMVAMAQNPTGWKGAGLLNRRIAEDRANWERNVSLLDHAYSLALGAGLDE